MTVYPPGAQAIACMRRRVAFPAGTTVHFRTSLRRASEAIVPASADWRFP